MKRVAVLHAQVPFHRGGAEALAEGLTAAINRELPGVRGELIQIPFKWYPEEQILADIIAWRLLDLTETSGDPIDLVIGTKFPSYAAKHPNKVLWLVHQHRVFYDLQGGEYDKLVLSPRDLVLRNKIRAMDAKLIREAKGQYTISHTVSERLRHFNGIDSQPISPPSALAEKITPGPYGDTIVCFARIDPLKRQHLLIEALAHCPRAQAVIIGRGNDAYRATLEAKIAELNLRDRCRLTGFTPDEDLIRYLANARAVFYAPHDEDYGYAAIEGFLARKPLITCTDSGEVRRFVDLTGSGWTVANDPEAIGLALSEAMAAPDDELARKAAAGYELARTVTWKRVLDQIVTPYL